MANRAFLIRAMARAAKLKAEADSQGGETVVLSDVLEELILGHFEASVTNGKTLISTSTGSSSASFTLPSELGPAAVMELAEETLAWCQQFTDPENPTLTTRLITRLQVDFSSAWQRL